MSLEFYKWIEDNFNNIKCDFPESVNNLLLHKWLMAAYQAGINEGYQKGREDERSLGWRGPG
jgi:hypothetical protein